MNRSEEFHRVTSLHSVVSLASSRTEGYGAALAMRSSSSDRAAGAAPLPPPLSIFLLRAMSSSCFFLRSMYGLRTLRVLKTPPPAGSSARAPRTRRYLSGTHEATSPGLRVSSLSSPFRKSFFLRVEDATARVSLSVCPPSSHSPPPLQEKQNSGGTASSSSSRSSLSPVARSRR